MQVVPYMSITAASFANPVHMPIDVSIVLLSVVLFATGIVTLTIADAEAYHVATYHPEKMAQMGCNRLVCYPSYLAETLMFCSFAILSRDTMSWLVLLLVFMVVFQPMNLAKERSIRNLIQAWADFLQESSVAKDKERSRSRSSDADMGVEEGEEPTMTSTSSGIGSGRDIRSQFHPPTRSMKRSRIVPAIDRSAFSYVLLLLGEQTLKRPARGWNSDDNDDELDEDDDDEEEEDVSDRDRDEVTESEHTGT